MRIDHNAIRPLELHPYRPGLCPRPDDEVVLQAALGAVVDEVDPRVDALVDHLRIGGDVRVPLRGVVAEEVVHDARQLLDARHAWLRGCSGQVHAHFSRADQRLSRRGHCVRRAQHQHRLAGRQKQCVAAPPRQEPHLRIDLAAVDFKAREQPAERLHDACRGGRVRSDRQLRRTRMRPRSRRPRSGYAHQDRRRDAGHDARNSGAPRPARSCEHPHHLHVDHTDPRPGAAGGRASAWRLAQTLPSVETQISRQRGVRASRTPRARAAASRSGTRQRRG